MKYIKHNNENYMNKKITDIREFFSNLKMITYHFEDYNIFNIFKTDIENELNVKCEMPFFGFSNLSESFFIPIIDTVTVQLHKMFNMIINNDYIDIYDDCNSGKLGYNRFIIYEKNGKYFSKIGNHMSDIISREVNDEKFKSYYYIRFRTRSFNNSEKIEEEKETNIINDIIDTHNLNDKYNISIYSSGSLREIKIISKNRIILNSYQKKEIENSKLFGFDKYQELEKLLSKQKEHNDNIENITHIEKEFNLNKFNL